MNGTRSDELEGLLESANEASKHCRNLYLLVLLVALYVILLVGSTTDEQLLRGTAVTLPLINVGLPIVGVYVVVPPLFVLIHFNLMLQLYVLSRKIFDLDETIASGADERRVDSFPFSQMLIGHHHPAAVRSLLGLIVFWAVVVIPLIVLMAVQIRFLPYHSDPISSFYAALLVIDVTMCWWFWPRMVSRRGRFGDWFEDTRETVRRWGPALVNGMLSLALLFLAVFVFVAPGGRLETWVPALARLNLLDRLDQATGAQRNGNRFRYLDVPEALLVREEIPAELLAAVVDKGEAALEQARVRFSKGLDLRGRDLRSANLIASRIYNADLRGNDTRLDRANLTGAQLGGSELEKADLRDANLGLANLRGADLSGANLRRAYLGNAELQGASLAFAKLQGARLTGARLWGANLPGAELQGANLVSAELQGANLRLANLQGATLTWAQLQGANLARAKLKGAILRVTGLYGVDLENADLSMAGMRNVSFIPLGEEAWRSIRDGISSNVPEGRRRNRALELIEEAMKRETSIRPERAEDAVYDSKQPEFAYMAERWEPPTDVEELEQVFRRRSEYLASLACTDEDVASGIVLRMVFSSDRSIAVALLKKREAAQARHGECDGLEEIHEGFWVRVRELTEPTPPP